MLHRALQSQQNRTTFMLNPLNVGVNHFDLYCFTGMCQERICERWHSSDQFLLFRNQYLYFFVHSVYKYKCKPYGVYALLSQYNIPHIMLLGCSYGYQLHMYFLKEGFG